MGALTVNSIRLLVGAYRCGRLRRCDRIATGRERELAISSAKRTGRAPLSDAADATEPDGTSALHWAVRNADLQIAGMLLEGLTRQRKAV